MFLLYCLLYLPPEAPGVRAACMVFSKGILSSDSALKFCRGGLSRQTPEDEELEVVVLEEQPRAWPLVRLVSREERPLEEEVVVVV